MARFADLGEFGPTLDAAAERLGISPTAVEKDYWVSEVLRVLGRDFDGDFIFKGGTSLSKGYRLVERFSEDIDVLVLPGERGRGATDRLMKAMADRRGHRGRRLGGWGRGSETGRHRSYEIAYPATREPTALIRTSVLLEMGVRGGPHPHTQRADQLPPRRCARSRRDRPRRVRRPRSPSRSPSFTRDAPSSKSSSSSTPWPSNSPPSTGGSIDRRSGRHFYDVYQLFGDRQVLDLLSDRDQTEQVMRSVEEINRAFFGGDGIEVRPAGGFGTCPAFDSTSDISTQLRAAYESTMPELYFGPDPLPDWVAICRRVAERRDLL